MFTDKVKTFVQSPEAAKMKNLFVATSMQVGGLLKKGAKGSWALAQEATEKMGGLTSLVASVVTLPIPFFCGFMVGPVSGTVTAAAWLLLAAATGKQIGKESCVLDFSEDTTPASRTKGDDDAWACSDNGPSGEFGPVVQKPCAPKPRLRGLDPEDWDPQN